MPQYLLQLAYTPEAWAAQVKDPRDRVEVVRPAVEALGGKMETGWLAFGEYDIVTVVEFPDNTSAAAFSISVSSKGGVKAIKTTPLLSLDEAVEAMRKAGQTGYQPPGS